MTSMTITNATTIRGNNKTIWYSLSIQSDYSFICWFKFIQIQIYSIKSLPIIYSLRCTCIWLILLLLHPLFFLRRVRRQIHPLLSPSSHLAPSCPMIHMHSTSDIIPISMHVCKIYNRVYMLYIYIYQAQEI